MFKEIKMQLIKSILRKFFSCTISLMIRLCRNEKVMLDIFSRSFEKYSDNYFCYKLRPKKASSGSASFGSSSASKASPGTGDKDKDAPKS